MSDQNSTPTGVTPVVAPAVEATPPPSATAAPAVTATVQVSVDTSGIAKTAQADAVAVGTAVEGAAKTVEAGAVKAYDKAEGAVEGAYAATITEGEKISSDVKTLYNESAASIKGAISKVETETASTTAEAEKLAAFVKGLVDKGYTGVEHLGAEAETELQSLYAAALKIINAPKVEEATVPATLPPNVVRVVFTKTAWGLASMIVRWALPRTRFAWALSSHCLIDDGTFLYEALPNIGVRKSPRAVALKGLTVVDTIDYTVPDQEMAYAFLESQLGKPYDLLGALGLALDPNRDWSEASKWFCYELAAAALKAGGLDVFSALSHISEVALMALKASVTVQEPATTVAPVATPAPSPITVG